MMSDSLNKISTFSSGIWSWNFVVIINIIIFMEYKGVHIETIVGQCEGGIKLDEIRETKYVIEEVKL